MYYTGHAHLGIHCHWCGAVVPNDGNVKTGNHLFCRNNGKCKMAHARAFKAYLACVTSRAATAPGLVTPGGPNGNAKRSAAMRTSSAEISAQPCVKSNAAKSARALKLDRLRTDTRSAGLLNSRKGKIRRISAHL